jgi:hypothetical protein
MKQTMKIHASTANASKSTAHLICEVPVRSTLEIAMEKAGLLVKRDAPKTVDPKLVEMYESLERQMILLRAAIHHDKIEKGLIVLDDTTYTTARPTPEPEPVVIKTHRSPVEIPILGQKKAKNFTAKAESAPADDFEPTPVKKAQPIKAKAETKPSKHSDGKEAFRTTFRGAVMEAFKATKPGTAVEAYTVNAENPESHKYRVYFTLSNFGSTVVIDRKPAKGKNNGFTAEVPLKNGELDPNGIPAFAYELK